MLRVLFSRFLGLFRKQRDDSDLDEEIRAHLDMATDENIRRGMSPGDARRAARRSFGGVEPMKESHRDARGLPRLEWLGQDARYAVRGLRRKPGFTVIAVLSLGIGIGLNASVFTWFKAVYLNPLPGVSKARELVTVNASYRSRSGGGYSNSYADYLYLRGHGRLFDGVFAHELVMLAVSDGGDAELTTGGIVSEGYFEVLGTEIAVGRGFLSEEQQAPDRNPVMILSHGLWQRRFGGDPRVIGRQLEINRTAFTVVGVAEPGFLGAYGGIQQEFWVPLQMARTLDPKRRDRLAEGSWLQIMGRPRDGVSVSEVQAEIDVLSVGMREGHRKDQPDYRAVAFPLHRAQRGYHSGMFEVVRVLGIAVGIVLLLACLNVANLLLARATDRFREISVRLSLGASRGRIVSQLLTESLVLAVLGASAGALLAYWSRSLPGLLSPRGLELYLNNEIDWTVFGFLAGISFVTALGFGLMPAIEMTRPELVHALKEGAGSVTASRRQNVWRRVLVAGQVALSMASLVGAALFAQHLLKLTTADRGFETENVLTATTDLFAGGLDEPRGRTFYRAVAEGLEALPGVASAAWTTFLPMSGSGGGNSRKVEVPGYEAADGGHLSVVVDTVTPGYLRTLGIPLVKGREFEWFDDATAAPVMMVDENFVAQYLDGREPVGAAVRIGDVRRTIVGLYRNYVYRSPAPSQRPTVLLPLAQDYQTRAVIVARTKTNPSLLAAALRGVIQDVNQNVPVFAMMTMEENVDARFADDKMATATLVLFGLIASALAAIGLYGLLGTFVSQRRRELAVRAALGATPADLRSLVITQGIRLTLAGLGAGIVVSIAFAQVLSASLPGAAPFDPLIYAAVAIAIAAVAAVSTLAPARTAGRMDSVVALRHE